MRQQRQIEAEPFQRATAGEIGKGENRTGTLGITAIMEGISIIRPNENRANCVIKVNGLVGVEGLHINELPLKRVPSYMRRKGGLS